MKKILSILLIILCLPAMNACTVAGAVEGSEPDGFLMKADIVSLVDGLEVNVTEAEYASGIYRIITSEETVVSDKKGRKISFDDLAVGESVYIVYNGQVMMSYPPQVVALSIKRA